MPKIPVSIFAICAISAFLQANQIARATEISSSPPPDLETWSGILDGSNLERVDRLGDRLSTVIFDAIDDITLFKDEVPTYGINLSVHRRVFDNESVRSTWTVVDRFDVAGTVPIYSQSLGSIGSNTPIGFAIGSSAGIQFTNIRQVSPGDYPNLPSPEERKEEIENASWYRDFVERKTPFLAADEPPGQWIYSLDGTDGGNEKKMLSFLPIDLPGDPETEARYSRFFNLVLFPFRIPLRASAVEKMEKDEIVSYLGTGRLQVGASIGWNLDPASISAVLDGGLSYSTYIQGTYRISVMKEAEKLVRVKATRIAGAGDDISIGTGIRPSGLDGILIIKNLQRYLRMVPFQLNVGRSVAQTFDVGYRYNLAISAAREAYEQAVIGKFGLSDELTADALGNSRDFAETGVEKVFSRTASTDGRYDRGSLQLGFVFRSERGSSLSNVDAVMTLPDGRHHVFTSVAENHSEWRFLKGIYERFEYNFRIAIDLDKYAGARIPDALVLTMEGKIEDAETSDTEMLEYELAVEDSIAKPRVFPRVPAGGGEMGRSHFYYRVATDSGQIEKFVELPEKEMWRHLEKAFHVSEGSWSSGSSRFFYRLTNGIFTLLNVPLYVAGLNLRSGSDLWHAERIYDRWVALASIEDPKTRVEALGRMFFDRNYGYELSYLIRSVLDGEQVSYYATGFSPVFGRVVDQGGGELHFDDIATRIQREIDFDNEGPRSPDRDSGAAIGELTVRQLDSERAELRFVLQKPPHSIYLQLMLSNWWWPFHNGKKGDLLVPNSGQYQEGENVIILDRSDSSSPYRELIKHLEPGNRYKLTLAVSNDGKQWGALTTATFRFKEVVPTFW